ncbi:MAG: type IV toxin-antitoxin system AbiEi family antitoxin domain-containing protein, partial [Baekduia sp.]
MRGLGAIESDIHALASRQHGLVARRQLLGLGLGADAIHHRLTNGRLVPVQRGIYALGHVELRREGHMLGVVLRYGDEAAVSHRSAAAVWGIRPWSGRYVELTLPGRGGTKKRPGRLLHRSGDLPGHEVTVERGIPTTTLPRTLLDLAAVVPPHHLRRAVERAEQAELFDLREVQRVLDAHPGRPGRRPLMALLADFSDHGDTITRSDLEAIMLQICLDHDLPRPQVNRYDGTRESDFRWPDHRLPPESPVSSPPSSPSDHSIAPRP